MMKFHPLHQKARQIVQAGQLGRPVFVRGQLSCWYPPIKGAWRQVPEQGGGGSLIDMAIHIYDLFQYILGARVLEVRCITGSLVHKYPVEDSATTLVRFANGCQGVVDTFFNIPDECCLRVMEIFGSKGAILAEGTIGQGGGTMKANLLGSVGGYDASQKRAKEKTGFQEIKPGAYNMYKAEVEALSDAILGNRAVAMNTIRDGVQVMRIAHAAYESARTGRTINL
jgi:predicted dehydrogenase